MLEFLKDHPVLWLLAAMLVLNALVGYKSQIDVWAERHPSIAGPLKMLRGAFPDPWLFISGLSLLFMKQLPTALQKETSRLPREVAEAVNSAIIHADQASEGLKDLEKKL